MNPANFAWILQVLWITEKNFEDFFSPSALSEVHKMLLVQLQRCSAVPNLIKHSTYPFQSHECIVQPAVG